MVCHRNVKGYFTKGITASLKETLIHLALSQIILFYLTNVEMQLFQQHFKYHYVLAN